MRSFELLLVGGTILTLILLAVPRARPMWTLAAGLAVAGLAITQLVVEGYRWQMLPAYALVAALLVTAALLRRPPLASHRQRVALRVGFGAMALLAVVAAILPIAVPMFQFPAPTGPYAIGTKTYHWVDESRADFGDPSAPRELMVQLWYPAEPATGLPRDTYIQDDMHFSPLPGGMPFPGFFFNHLNDITTHALVGAPAAMGEPFPVLIFSPGATGFRQHNTFEVEELVSHGYVVAGIDHPRAAREVVFPDGRRIEFDPILIDVPRFLTDEQFGEERYNYLADDVSFALDRIAALDDADPTLSGHLDLAHVGMFGVSLGGLVTSEVCRKDPRFGACLVQDVFVPADAIAAGAPQPTMWLATDAASMRAQGWPEWEVALHQDTMRAAFESARSDGYFVHLPGTFHLNYTDLPYTVATPIARALGLIGPLDWRRAHGIVSAYALAFFDRHLKGEAGTLLDGASPSYPEVQLEARHG